MNKKSPLVAFILAFLLGSLGLFYVSVTGAIVLTVVSILALLTIPTLIFYLWIISIVWNVYGAFSHNNDLNQKLAAEREQQEQADQLKEAEDEWTTLVKYDATVQAAVEKVQQFGDEAIAELRKAYAVVKDKEQLPRIADQIVSEHA